MKIRIALSFCILLLLNGCYLSGRLYPVAGPLAASTPPPILAAKMTGFLNTGKMTVTLVGGEVCKGTWGLVSQQPTGNSGGDAAAPSPVDWPAAWDTVYGKGFYTANVLGAKLHVHGTLKGNRGSTLYVELYRRDIPGQVTESRGVAADGAGNIYKIVL